MTRLKMYFFCVTESSEAYKLFNPLTKKIVINKDVTFDEESTWDWNRQQPTQILFDSDVEQEKFSAPYVLKNSSVSTPTTPPFVVVANEEATQNLGNVRRRPAWIKDSKVTGIKCPITHIALFFQIVILHLLRVP